VYGAKKDVFNGGREQGRKIEVQKVLTCDCVEASHVKVLDHQGLLKSDRNGADMIPECTDYNSQIGSINQ
jgi:hypothetical protein